MFVFDAHLDLAMNAMEWNRDLRLPVAAIREREAHLNDKPEILSECFCKDYLNFPFVVDTIKTRTMEKTIKYRTVFPNIDCNFPRI